MGWGSGSMLMSDLICAAKACFGSHDERVNFYEKAIRAFEMEDADTLDECVGKDSAFDAAWLRVHPRDE